MAQASRPARNVICSVQPEAQALRPGADRHSQFTSDSPHSVLASYERGKLCRGTDVLAQSGESKTKSIPGGLVDYLSMTPEQRRADYRARLEKVISDQPDDAAAQLDYLELELDERATQSVQSTVRRLAEIKGNSAVLAKAGRALLESAHYAEAKDLLGRIPSPSPEAQLDLALAALHAGDEEAAARQLNALPESSRGADFYLARTQMRLAIGDADASSAALDIAANLKTARPALIRETAGLLIDRNRPSDALRLLDSAVGPCRITAVYTSHARSRSSFPDAHPIRSPH